MTARVRKSTTRRRLLGVFGVLALAVVAAVVYVQLASANASVTTQGSVTENADQANAGTYVTISNIVVTEGANTDFGSNTGGAWPATSFVLTPPANWQFQAGQAITPTVAGGNITGATAAPGTLLYGPVRVDPRSDDRGLPRRPAMSDRRPPERRPV